MSPYKTLGIRRDATDDSIRKAYRRMAMKHHPDRGGDSAKFEQVQAAYDLLTDPVRRARYDECGDASDPRRVSESAAIMTIVSPMLAEVVRQMVDQGGNPEAEDIVSHLETAFEQTAEAHKKELAKLQSAKTFLGKSVSRFKFKDGLAEGENMLSAAARAHLGMCEQQIKAIEQGIHSAGKALEYLKKYKYEFTKTLAFGMPFGNRMASFSWRTT